MSCCGGNCGCGSDCKCGGSCGGCKMNADLSYTEADISTASLISGVAPIKSCFEGSEMGAEAENGVCRTGFNGKGDVCNRS